jgi:hypothetical protein
MVVEAFEFLSGCCKATPRRSVPLSSWGTSLSGALGRVTLFSGRPERSLPSGHRSAALQLRRRCSRGHLEQLSAIRHSFEPGGTQFVPSWVNNSVRHPPAGTSSRSPDGPSLSEARYCSPEDRTQTAALEALAVDAYRVIAALECPLWVISGHCPASASCLLYPRNQTFLSASGMSAKCQKRTSRRRANLVRWCHQLI